jgi:hypothetical protein
VARSTTVKRAPVRIQHHRGVKLPSRARLVARPTRWGNRFKLDPTIPAKDVDARVRDRVDVLVRYRRWLDEQLRADPAFLEPLRGRDLACWCRLDVRCHADILLEQLARTP